MLSIPMSKYFQGS